jgi:hypothetical protein
MLQEEMKREMAAVRGREEKRAATLKREKEERIKADAVIREKLLAALAAEEEKARSDTKKGLE